jgi:DNA-binding transcriptional LysR family regulator
MDLDLVSLFAAVAEVSSFTEAARKLRLPPSTLSRAVTSLEEKLRMPLFHRTTRHVSLTVEGESLYQRVAPALAAVRDALGAVPERKEEPSGLLRLTAAPDIGALYLADVVTRFTARHPAVRVDVSLTNRAVDLVRDGFDAAVRASSKALRNSALLVRKLGPIDFLVFAAPTYLALRGTPRHASDLVSYDWVEKRGVKHPREPKLPAARVISDDFLFIREAIRSGGGLGFLPSFLAHADVASGQLVQVLPEVCPRIGQLVFLHAKVKQTPRRLTAFRDFLLQRFSDDQPAARLRP